MKIKKLRRYWIGDKVGGDAIHQDEVEEYIFKKRSWVLFSFMFRKLC